MSYIIRKAALADKPAVLALARTIVDVYERTHLGDEVADAYINSGNCDNDLSEIYDNATIILDGNNIIGFLFTDKNEIQGLSVDVPYWGKGIAQQLIAYAVNNIFTEYDEIKLECFVASPRANRFYQKIGFVNCGIVEGDGASRVLYKQKISKLLI